MSIQLDIIFISLYKYIVKLGEFVINPDQTLVIREHIDTTQQITDKDLGFNILSNNNYSDIKSFNNIPSNKFYNIINHLSLIKCKSNNIIYFNNDNDKLFWMIVYPLFKDNISLFNIEYYNVSKFINNIKIFSIDKSLVEFINNIYTLIYTNKYKCIICNKNDTTSIFLCCLVPIHLGCLSNRCCPLCGKQTNIFNKNYSYCQRLYDTLYSLYIKNPINHLFVCKNKKIKQHIIYLSKYKSKKFFPIFIKDINLLNKASAITYITNVDYNINCIIKKENKINRDYPIVLNVVQY